MSQDSSDLRFVDDAEVRKAGRRVGRLGRVAGGSEFAYDPDYRGAAVAASLPLGAAPVRAFAGAVPPFFAGLLPEGRRLSAVRTAIKCSADDDFSLLMAIGHDTIGDVTVVPVGAPPYSPPAPTPLADVHFASLLGRVLGPEGADRVGLPGVQDKLSSAMISLPLQLTGGPFLLKLSPPGFSYLVENEAFFLDAARDSGIPVAEKSILRDVSGERGLLIRRFDRVCREGIWTSLPQEDACQVLGRYPADKYRVSSEEALAALCHRASAPMVCARDLFRQLAFAYLTANGDAHGKNFSVQQAPDGEWLATPAYDIPSSQPYDDHTMALRLNGKDRQDIGRSDFLALAAQIGLLPRAAARVLDDLADAAPTWISRLEDLPFNRQKVHKLRRVVTYRCERIATKG